MHLAPRRARAAVQPKDGILTRCEAASNVPFTMAKHCLVHRKERGRVNFCTERELVIHCTLLVSDAALAMSYITSVEIIRVGVNLLPQKRGYSGDSVTKLLVSTFRSALWTGAMPHRKEH